MSHEDPLILEMQRLSKVHQLLAIKMSEKKNSGGLLVVDLEERIQQIKSELLIQEEIILKNFKTIWNNHFNS